jgi:hypothetical protein
MATFQIIAVRTDTPTGHSHEHIAAVEIKGGGWLERSTVIGELRATYGDSYITKADGVRAVVIAVECPFCGDRHYITTMPGPPTENDLLKLPRG